MAVGVSRGFIREVSSILAWILAGVATFWDIPLLRTYMASHIETTLVANAVAALVAFVIAFTIVSLIGTICASLVRGTLISPLDRLCGALVGVAKGAFLLGCLEILACCFVPRSSFPDAIIEESLFSPALFALSDWLRHQLPESILCYLDRLARQNGALVSKEPPKDSLNEGAAAKPMNQGGEHVEDYGKLAPKETPESAKASEGTFTKEQKAQLNDVLNSKSEEIAAPVVFVDPGEKVPAGESEPQTPSPNRSTQEPVHP